MIRISQTDQRLSTSVHLVAWHIFSRRRHRKRTISSYASCCPSMNQHVCQPLTYSPMEPRKGKQPLSWKICLLLQIYSKGKRLLDVCRLLSKWQLLRRRIEWILLRHQPDLFITQETKSLELSRTMKSNSTPSYQHGWQPSVPSILEPLQWSR